MTGRGSKRPPFLRSSRSTDLTSILTLEEKDDLVVLLTDIVDTLEQQILRRFENTRAPDAASHPQQALQPRSARQVDTLSKENRPPIKGRRPVQEGLQQLVTSQQVNDIKHDKQHQPDALRDVSTFPELKKELLIVFQKWQNSILTRIKDISVRETESPLANQRGGRGGRGRRGGGRGDSLLGSSDRQPTAASSGPTSKRGTNTTTTGLPGNQVALHGSDSLLNRQYEPRKTPLSDLPLEKKKLLLHLTLLVVISLDAYSAYSRLLMLYLTSSLRLERKRLQEEETRLAQGLGKAAEELDLDLVMQERTTENKKSRKWKAAGASLISSSGSLAKPLESAGVGSAAGLDGATAAKLLGNVNHNGVVVGNLMGIYAGRDTGKMIDQYAKESADFAFLSIDRISGSSYRDSRSISMSERKLRFVIGVGGWLTKENGAIIPFRCLRAHGAESYVLEYEIANLMALGTALELLIFKSALWGSVSKEMLERGVFTCLLESRWPLGLLRLCKVIDNPWNMGMVRCEKAGMALAECIGRKIQGDRPVSLVGYSLGARAIYVCLMALAERRQFGLIENVVLIGTPAPADSRIWLNMRSIVSGRLINVYSENDWLLGFLYRSGNLEYGVAGLQKVNGFNTVENFNVSNLIKGHLRYQYMISKILKAVGWEDLDHGQVLDDEAVLAKKDRKARRPKVLHVSHLPVDKTIKPVYRPAEPKTINELETRMMKMKIQG